MRPAMKNGAKPRTRTTRIARGVVRRAIKQAVLVGFRAKSLRDAKKMADALAEAL